MKILKSKECFSFVVDSVETDQDAEYWFLVGYISSGRYARYRRERLLKVYPDERWIGVVGKNIILPNSLREERKSIAEVDKDEWIGKVALEYKDPLEVEEESWYEVVELTLLPLPPQDSFQYNWVEVSEV